MSKFLALDFFAGSGLATQALSSSFEVIWANDICAKKTDVYLANHKAKLTLELDKATSKSLKNGEKVFYQGDIAAISGKIMPKVALSWASFPCQDLSLAGNLKGIDGSRSGLVWEWLRVMDEMPQYPNILVAENVPGLLSANGGEYYRKLHTALSERGYKVGPLVLDAARWLPQSRSRVFVVAVKDSIESSDFQSLRPNWAHSEAAIQASKGLEKFVWWKMPEPPKRKIRLSDVVEFDAPIKDHSASKRNLNLIPEPHRKKLELLMTSLKAVPGYKRTRDRQVLELRFDGIAGCLRTPRGGSSRQCLVLKQNDELVSRLLTVREAARLMGASDDFKLPGSYNDGYKAMGDGVAIPVVNFLAKNLLEPLARRAK